MGDQATHSNGASKARSVCASERREGNKRGEMELWSVNIWQYTSHGARKARDTASRTAHAERSAGRRLGSAASRFHGSLRRALRRDFHTSSAPQSAVGVSHQSRTRQAGVHDGRARCSAPAPAKPTHSWDLCLGSRSVMLQDEPTHMTDRKRILPSFHGQRMHDYGEMMADVARREIDRWPIGEPFELWPRMQAISLEVVMRAVFSDVEGERLELLRRRMVDLTNWVNDPGRLALLAAVGERSMTANPNFAQGHAPSRAARAGGGASAQGRRRRRAPRRHPRDARATHGGGGRPDGRREAARRTRDVPLRRPHGDLARVGVRAAAAPPRQARAPARGGARRRERGVRRRGCQGDTAPVSRGAGRYAAPRPSRCSSPATRSLPTRSSPRAST